MNISSTDLHPLALGNKIFSSNLIQGPLAGYSCWPMRVLAQQHGPPAFCYTEMLSAKTLINTPSCNIPPRFRLKDPREGPLCVQLSGINPEELAKATERVMEWGADLIDLNCGCPVTKIRQKGAGSKLLENPNLLQKLIAGMRSGSANSLPISIKIRVDSEDSNFSNLSRYSLEAALAAQEAGVDFITIHGRHWAESYDTPCRQDQITEIIEKLNIPVIANGDAHDTASTLNLLKNTGAAGVMIARAALGQPWLFKQITQEASGGSFILPTPQKIGELFLEHLEGLISLEGEKIAILQARKLIKYYGRFLLNTALNTKRENDFLEHAKKVQTQENMKKLVKEFFK